MAKYIIRAALHDEANEGWIWQGVFPSRTIVRISRRTVGKTFRVYCQVRAIEKNFVDIYNQTHDEKDQLKKVGKNCRHDLILESSGITIVMGDWYRSALGGFDTSSSDDEKERQLINEIKAYDRWWNRWWGSMRAAAHHPDIIVRIGARLGVLGFGIGAASILPTVLTPFVAGECERAWWAICSTVGLVLFSFLACSGPSRLPEK